MKLTASSPARARAARALCHAEFLHLSLLLTTLPLFATVPQGLAQRWQAQYALRADAPPVAYPEFTLCILRHKRRAQDPALNWLVAKLNRPCAVNNRADAPASGLR
ncbi:hypothetical protein LN650_18335 [Klebsiella pneumoniae subsp. pneumoniae]|nr:hypothetical protein [Klebsiella pneumoniae subsp. pneumoniae]